MLKSKRISVVIAISIAFSLTISACGPKPSPEPPPPPIPVDRDLLLLVPAGVDAVLMVDMAALRTTRLFQGISTFLGEEGLPFIEETETVDPLEQSDEILVLFASDPAQSTPDDPGELAILMKGRFRSADILGLVAERPDAASVPLGEFKAVRDEDLLIFAPTDRTVVVGTPSLVKTIATLATGKGPSLREDSGFADFSATENETVLFRYRLGGGAPDLAKLGKGKPFVKVDDIVAMDAHASIGEGITASMKITAKGEKETFKMFQQIERTRKKLKGNMLVMFIGIDWILDRITVTSEKANVFVSIEMNGADIEEIVKLAEKLDQIKKLAGGAAQETGLEELDTPTPPPSTPVNQ